MTTKTGTDPFKFPIKFGKATFNKGTAGINCTIGHTAIGTLSQTLALLTRGQFEIKIFESDQTEKLNKKDSLVYIKTVANTGKVSHDIDDLTFGFSFGLDSVNHASLIFYAYQEAMIEVKRVGDAGKGEHHDDAEGQGTLDSVEGDETPDEMEE